ncbi:MAG: glycosyltransferase family 4 protein [Candidatus Dadabacteria bacterium]|nr:glycosyltransferase family 4 protein [Candidatus Dadabacteria bacterium]
MSSLKKVLFINHSIRDGGPGRSMFYIMKYLDRTKIAPYVLVPKHDIFSEQMESLGLRGNVIVDPRFPENIMRGVFSDNNASGADRRFRTSGLKKGVSIFLNVLGLLSLILTSPFLLRGRRVDVIYCNGTLAKITGALIGLLNRRPVIWHVRNIQQTAAMKLTMRALSRLRVVRRIICVSEAAAMQFSFVRDKVRVINNGVDTEEFSPGAIKGELRDRYKFTKNTIVVGSVGRIVPRKGYEFLISAALEVKKQLTESEQKRVKFVIVGDTPHFFRLNHLDYLKELVKKYGLDDVVIFTGYKSDVRPYLKDFDIFVIPSNYPDPFPRVVIEAMAFSLPVIGFKQGGITEAVEGGITGFLLNSEGSEKMGESIMELIGNPKRRKAMGKAGRLRVEARFQASIITTKIQDEILDVLGDRSA